MAENNNDIDFPSESAIRSHLRGDNSFLSLLTSAMVVPVVPDLASSEGLITVCVGLY